MSVERMPSMPASRVLSSSFSESDPLRASALRGSALRDVAPRLAGPQEDEEADQTRPDVLKGTLADKILRSCDFSTHICFALSN